MAEQSASYLNNLKFDPKLGNSFIGRYLTNPRLLILTLLTVLAVGLSSYFSLPRRLNPEVKIPLVIISTVLPGAGPNDIESLVTIPLENAVNGLDGLDTVSSSSRDSVSIVQLEFRSGVDPDKARADVQSAIDAVALPEDAQEPTVQKLDFENQPVVIYTLTGADTVSLTRFAENLREKIDDLGTVDRVEVSGIEEQEVQIVIKPEAVATYSLNPLQLSQIIKSSLGSYPAGSVETDVASYALTIDPAVASIDELRELVVSVKGTPVPLSQVAIIALRTKPLQQTSYYATAQTAPQKAVSMSVFKTASANITTAASDIEHVVDEELERYPGQFQVEAVINTAEEIDEQFNELIRDFLITMVLVFISLFIFLGARQAIVAVVSAPLTFLIAFAVMSFTGISLNFLSLFSLLLSLGLLVDDTIVVISAMTAYFRTGRFTPVETGLLVWRDFLVPIFTTTLTTVWAFLPLLLSTGIIGEFIKSIPIVVSTTLLASFFVAMFINLPLIVLLLKPNFPNRVRVFLKILLVVILLAIFYAIVPKGPILILETLALILVVFVTHIVRMQLFSGTKQYARKSKSVRNLSANAPRYAENGIIHFEVIASRYRKLVRNILGSPAGRRSTIAMVVLFSLFSYLLLPLGFVKNEFFPKADSKTLYVAIELPAGTTARISEQEAVKLLDDLRRIPGMKSATANIGQGFNATQGQTSAESNNVLLTITLEESNSIAFSENLRDRYATYQPGRIQVIEQSGGPPAGADLQIELSGEDLSQLSAYADRLTAYLENTEGTTNVDKSIKSGTSKLVFVPEQEKLAQYNLTPDVLGLWLRLYASGVPTDTVTFVKDNGDETDITIRLNQGTQAPEDVTGILVPAAPLGPPTGQQPGGGGGTLALADLGKLTLEPNPTLITRENGKRTITVTAGVQPGFNTADLNRGLEEFANTKLNLPEGYSWQTGGVNEENQNSVNSILQAMILSFLLIIITMVLQFASFRKALIVMLVIPLSISGVFIIFALTQTPLSFPALIGVLALFGIVVKNSILVVDKITANEKAGLPFVESIADGAASRLEAIALTSLTAIVGLIPITLSDPLWRGLGGAIISGLFFSGTIMLFFIPVVYYYWFHPRIKPTARQRRQSR
jgi:multidrug efflux pump subunit AcrB